MVSAAVPIPAGQFRYIFRNDTCRAILKIRIFQPFFAPHMTAVKVPAHIRSGVQVNVLPSVIVRVPDVAREVEERHPHVGASI
jgi:hypothetical protein